jgi:hypothetical protein
VAGPLRVNVKGLEKFQRNLAKLTPKARQDFSETALKDLAARLLTKVIKRTPVGQYKSGSGKVGGTLRRGWTIGDVAKKGPVYTIEVLNDVVYGPYVEFGHRTRGGKGWVEGRFMMTVSEQELMTDAPRVLQRKLDAFIKGFVNG